MDIKNRDPKKMLLQGIFYDKNKIKYIAEKINTITENINQNKAFIYLGKIKEYTFEIFKKAVSEIVKKSPRDYQIDPNTFVSDKVEIQDVINQFVYSYDFDRAPLFSLKTKKKAPKSTLELINVKNKKIHAHAKILSNAINYTRNLQIMPPNILRSTNYANQIKKDFEKHKNIKITILDKIKLKALKMGLILSVNSGSNYDARVVVLEYNGDPGKKQKTAIVGKGITFDGGGYNIKVGSFMLGMKFDMSGSAIVAGVMQAIANLKPKANVVGVMMITDNLISSEATTPDSVIVSMNGKSVEINNTDAEGRLVLADGITYAIRNLKASRVIDVATLTGAITIALGDTYAGCWATNDNLWQELHLASKKANELIWRMPFHEEYAKNIRKSEVADLKNTDLTRKAGSSSAAMFLKEFTENVEYIHLDIAGVAEINEIPQGPMVRTLYELINK